MPEEKKADDLEKLLSDEKSLQDRKKALIDDLLKQRAAAIADFDERLARLGYKENSDKPKRSHHKKSSARAASTTAKAKAAASPAEGSGKPPSPTVPHRRR